VNAPFERPFKLSGSPRPLPRRSSPPYRRRILFEALEPRLLLSADAGIEPLLLIPGFGATQAAAPALTEEWLTTRGIAPDKLQIDPLANSAADLIQSLENVGYSQNQDDWGTNTPLIVANWDWRVPVAERDAGDPDGVLSGVSAASITDWAVDGFDTALDYLGYYLDLAAQAGFGSVDVISHSTGGLVARAYMQSAAYGAQYDSDGDGFIAGDDLFLPTIDDLILVGVPNEGVSQSWNLLMDDFNVKSASRGMAHLLDLAWDLMHEGTPIAGPGGDITSASLAADDPLTPQDEAKLDFARRYVGAAHDLVGTYDLLDSDDDGLYEAIGDVAGLEAFANTLVADINFGLGPADLVERTGTGKTIIVYGDEVDTLGLLAQRTGFTPEAGLQNELLGLGEVIGHLPADGQVWYEDRLVEGGGDGTVAALSAKGPFDGIASERLVLERIAEAQAGEKVGHTELLINSYAQKQIIDHLTTGGVIEAQISQGLAFNPAQTLAASVALGVLQPRELVLSALDDIARLLDDLVGAEALNTPLPFLDKSMIEVVPFATAFRTAVSNARAAVDENATIEQLNSTLATHLGPGFSVGFQDGQVTIDLDFSADEATTVSVPIPGDVVQGELDLDLDVDFRFDVSLGVDLTDSGAGKDMVFLRIDEISASASAVAADIDLGVVIGPLAAEIVDGTASVAARIDFTLVDPNDDGKLTFTEVLGGLKDLPGFLDPTLVGELELVLPIDVELVGFDFGPYGTPTVHVSDAQLFDAHAPQVVVDIRINAGLRDEILGVLDSIEGALGSATDSLDSLLATEIPGIGKTVRELLGVRDLSALLDLKTPIAAYFGQFSFTGESFPTVRGVLAALNDAWGQAGALDLNLDDLKAAGKNFAGMIAQHADLRGFDLRGADLRGVDFSFANLAGVDLRGADLRGAILHGVNLVGALLDGADLRGIDLSGAFALDASFKGVKSDGSSDFADLFVDLRTQLGELSPLNLHLIAPNVDLSGLTPDLKALFRNFDLSGLDLSGVNLTGFDLSGMNLRGVKFLGATLDGVDLSDAFTLGADFDLGVDLSDALADVGALLAAIRGGTPGLELGRFDFSGLDLSGIDFSGLDLRNLNLRDALNVDLSGVTGLFNVDLRGATLPNVDLSGLDLRFANLEGLDLSGFNLEGAKLIGAKLGGVVFDAVTNLKGSLLQGADLSGASGVDLANRAGALFDSLTRLPDGIGFGGMVEVSVPDVFTPSSAAPFTLGGGFDFDARELRLDLGVNLRPLLDVEFDFDAGAVGAGDFGVGLSGAGRLTAGAVIELDAFFGVDLSDLGTPEFAAGDAVYFGLDTLRAGAGVRVADLDLLAQLGPVSGGVLGGHGEIVVAAQVAISDGDANDDGKIQLSELGGLQIGFGVEGSLDVALPLTVTLPLIGTITDFGTPTVRIQAEELIVGSAPNFATAAPTVTLDILLGDQAVQDALLGLLLDLKDNGLGAIGFLNEDLPVINRSINDLVGVGIGGLLDLHTSAAAYFGSFDPGGTNDGGTPNLSGLVEAIIDGVVLSLPGGVSGRDGAGPFSLSGGIDFATRELRFAAGFDLEKSTDIGFDLAELLPDPGFVSFSGSADASLLGQVSAGLGIVLDLDALFGSAELQDSVAFLFDPFSVRGELHATDIDLIATLGPLEGGVEGGTLDLVLGATLAITDPDGDGRVTLREMKTAGLGNLIELDASASVDATLPLTVVIAGFNVDDYGLPVVRISGENFLTFDLAGTPQFQVQRPDIAFDILITAEVRDALMGVLNDLDAKIDGIVTDGVVADVLGFELPGLGITIGDLLKINDILDAFNLKDVVDPFFAQYDFVTTFPSLFELLGALNDGVADASSTEIDEDNPASAKGNFAGFNASGFDLRGFDFSGAILAGVDFTGANLAGVDFTGADLRGAILSGANLRGADFSGARLQNALLDGAFAIGAIFSNARISAGTSIGGLIFDRSTVWQDGKGNRSVAPSLGWSGAAKSLKAGLSLAGKNLSGWDLSGLDLSGIDFSGSDLSSANLRNAILKGANLANANVKGLFAVGADLSGAVTTGAQGLSQLITNFTAGTNLSGVSLRGWDLSGLDLNGVSFAGLDLSWVKLEGASHFNATGIAKLLGADLRGVDFAAGFDKVLAGIELRFADLSGLDLTGFDLSGLNLKGIKLANANLSGVDFGSALLQGVDLSKALNLGAANLGGAFYDALTDVGSLLGGLAGAGGVLAEIPEDLFFTPFDGPAFRFTGGFDPDALKASIGLEMHLRQIFDFGFDFDATDLGLSDFSLGPIHLDAETLLQGGFDAKVGMGVDFGASFGVYLGELLSEGVGAAFIQLDSIRAGAGVKAGFDLTADLGVVSGGVLGGTASLTAGIVGDLKQGDTSILGQELRLDDLSTASLSFDKGAALHVNLPVDIVVGSFHLSSLGLTPTLSIDDDNLFAAPGPVFDTGDFLDDLKRAALGVLTADLDFLVGDDGVLRGLVTGLKDFVTDDVFGALPLPFLPQSQIDSAADTLFSPIIDFLDLLDVAAGDQSPIELLQSALFAVFGPDALNILADSDGVAGITRDDVLFTYRDALGGVVATLGEADAIQINMRLAKSTGCSRSPSTSRARCRAWAWTSTLS
jgi:uncharacterized protein YjbI with pentapeptide repeats